MRFAELGITRSTKVWCQGMADWQYAGDIPELLPYLTPAQPGGFTPPPAGSPYGFNEPAAMCPPTYLVWSILATLLCCLPLGVVGIVYATQVENEWNLGKYAEAYKKSRLAKNWTIASAVTGVLSGLIYLVLFCLGVFASALENI